MTIPNLDALVARYGENARVIDVKIWERERKAAQARVEMWREPSYDYLRGVPCDRWDEYRDASEDNETKGT